MVLPPPSGAWPGGAARPRGAGERWTGWHAERRPGASRAARGPAGGLLGRGTEVGDQFGPQVALGELVAEPGDGKADHVTGGQGQLVQACLGGEAAEPSPLLVGDVDGGSVVRPLGVLGHRVLV